MKLTYLGNDEVKIGRTKYRLISDLTNTIIVELNSERVQFIKKTGEFVKFGTKSIDRGLPLSTRKFWKEWGRVREIEKELIKNYNAMSESDRYNDAYLAGYRQCVVDFQKQKNLASAENTN